MEEEYMDSQDSAMADVSRNSNEISENLVDSTKDFGDVGYDEGYDDEDGGNNFRGGRGRGNFNRGRGPPPGWMNGPPMRFRGRGYGPAGPPMRGRGFYRGRGGPRGFNNGPNFDNNWGPMGPPPPGMMGGPPPGMMGGPPFGPPPGMMPPGGPMGPPPNMMGQPPPFGGPPGMPPPNMPAPEIWVETKSEEGKPYYYHARTRETTWTRPQEGPTVKVITQADMEAMATTQMPMGGPGPGMPMNGPMGPMGMMPNGMMPPGVNPGNNVPSFMSQPPPWVKDGMKDKSGDDDCASDNDELPPGETAMSQNNLGPNGNMMNYPPNFNFPGGPGGSLGPTGPAPTGNNAPSMGQPPMGQPPMGQPPMGQPPMGQPPMGQGQNSMPPNMGHGMSGPPGGGWGWPGWPPAGMPPTGMPPGGMPPAGMPPVGGPPPSANHHVPDSTSQVQPAGAPSVQGEPTLIPDSPPADKEPTTIPAELVAAASAWSSHRAPDGRAYYYHAARQESVWEKPKPMRDLEELQAKLGINKGDKFEKKNDAKVVEIDDTKVEVIDVDAHDEAQAALEAERAAAEKDKLEKEKQEKEKEKEKAKQDRSRPITSTPILGTPWCVVWTGDGSVFFYNSAAHSSVWERPAALLGRADVDKAVTQPPQALLDLQRKDAASSSSSTTSTKTSNGELKRAADSSSDDSADSTKKPKQEDEVSTSTSARPVPLNAAAAVAAEVLAARERGALPHAQRLKAFTHMLIEKQVSAFSTWEKELHKIVFDPRYLMLNSKERRQVFDQYVRDRAEEERKEKKNRIQQKKSLYRALMEEAKLHSKSSFSDFTSKHGRDERYKAIEKSRDRENYFNEFLAELRKREKEEKEKAREQMKTDFIALLKEKAVDRHARWLDAKKKVDSDPRYKAVESSTTREDYFKEYCRLVKEERKKDKDEKEKKRERTSSKKDKKEKERDKDKDKDEKKDGKKEKKKEKGDAPEEAEEQEPEEQETEAAREKEARAQASIKEREREVQRALATSLRDRDKEREYHKRDEAVQHFNALLADLVRNPDLSWRDAKKQLKKDHRYSLAELLTKDDKERLFVQHTSALSSKRRDKLRTLLQEKGITCTAHWRDVKTLLSEEPTAPAYETSSQMEREFRDYQRDKLSLAKSALRQLLLETRTITHRSLAAVRAGQAMQALLDTLKGDNRYTALDHIPDERQQIVMSYLEELEKKGPPPPPTATEPSRRTKQ